MQIIDISQTLTKHDTKKYIKRDIFLINQIIVHHTADKDQIPEHYARMHVCMNDWPAIGYHYMISKSGVIFKVNDESIMSYHCKGQNKRSIGISLMGNYSTELIPMIQSKSLQDLIQLLKLQFNIIEVKKHSDYSKTECPGLNFKLF